MSIAPYAVDAPRNTYRPSQQNPGPESLPLVHRNHLTVAERKRLQWAKDREEEQTLLNSHNKQRRGYQNTSILTGPYHTESVSSASKDIDAQRKGTNVLRAWSDETVSGEKTDTYNPWGKPGGGARHVRPVRAEDPEADTKFDCLGRPVLDKSLIQEMRDVRSRPPQTSEDSKKVWMAELKSQMEEKKQRQLKERESDNTLGDMSWLDRFTTDHKPAPLPEQLADLQDKLSKSRSYNQHAV